MKTFAKISVVRKSLRTGSVLEKGSMDDTTGGISESSLTISSVKYCPYGHAKYSCPYVNVDYSSPCPCVHTDYSAPTGDDRIADISAE
ncbi:MAG: hypothetical protein GY765_34690 [bacterium]|nr:hypothetical protein [bacterium]